MKNFDTDDDKEKLQVLLMQMRAISGCFWRWRWLQRSISSWLMKSKTTWKWA